MTSQPLPLIVLAGADRRAGALPEGATVRALTGAKGMDVQLAGRPLVEHVVERMRESGDFAPVFIAGPVDIYGLERGGAEVIDTDGTFGDNIDRSVAAVRARFPDSPIALTTCDILPTVEDLRRVLDDYRAHAPSDFWFPMIIAPDDPRQLGASAWKPRYRVRESPGGAARAVLPGHLIVVAPQVIHHQLALACFELAYATRNRGPLRRALLMVRHLLLRLLLQDLRYLLTLEPPLRTIEGIGNGVMLARRLRSGVISRQEVEQRLSRIFVRRAHRREHPDRQGRLPFLAGLSLAKDIDTREEADEARRLAGGGAPPS